MRIVFAKQFLQPSMKAHPLQVVRTAAAAARLGHDCFILPVVRRKGSAKELVRESLGSELPSRLQVCEIAARSAQEARSRRSRRLLRLLLSFRGDLIFYSRNRRETVELLKWRRRLFRRHPVIHEFHNLDHLVPDRLAPGETRETTFDQEAAVWNHADALVAISDSLRDELHRCFLEVREVSVIGGGADLESFSSVPAGLPDSRPVILTYAGGLYPYKGVNRLFDALSGLPENYHLRFIGGSRPEDLARLRERADGDPVFKGRVEFCGHVAPSAVPGQLAGSHLLLLPASDDPRQQRFTSPVKLFEYLATGIPILAAPTPAYRSVISDGVDAFVAEDCDGSSLAQAALRAMGDDSLRERVGRGALKRAEEFTWERRAERIAALCAESLAGPSHEGARL